MRTESQLKQTAGYWIEEIRHQLVEMVRAYLEENKITQTAFANELGVTKGYVSQLLNGSSNITLKTMVRIVLATGHAPDFRFVALETEEEAKATAAPAGGVEVDLSEEDFLVGVPSDAAARGPEGPQKATTRTDWNKGDVAIIRKKARAGTKSRRAKKVGNRKVRRTSKVNA
ncbi:MAG: helix-turn-helix transcriptional regulator [Bacteroidota bacterium]